MTQIASSSAPSATQAGKPATDPALAKAAQQFEAIFLRQMIASMRQGSLAEGLFDNGATEQFRDMADAKTADNLSKTGSFGIAELMMRQLSRPTAPATPGSPAVNAAYAPPSGTAGDGQ